jgi:hypothetical protein
MTSDEDSGSITEETPSWDRFAWDTSRFRCPECREEYPASPQERLDPAGPLCPHCAQRTPLDTFRARLAQIHKMVEDEATHPWRDVIGQRRQHYARAVLRDALDAARDTLSELHAHSREWIDFMLLLNRDQDDPEKIVRAQQNKALVDERVRGAEGLLAAFWDAVYVDIFWNPWGGGPESPPAPQPSVTIAEHWNVITRRKSFWDIRKLNLVPADPDDNWQYRLRVARGVYLIRDLRTGVQYVGAAYGENGLWRRFKEYLKTNGHDDPADHGRGPHLAQRLAVPKDQKPSPLALTTSRSARCSA